MAAWGARRSSWWGDEPECDHWVDRVCVGVDFASSKDVNMEADEAGVQSVSAIKDRKCPSCQHQIKRFALTGLYTPHEAFGVSSYQYLLERDAIPFVGLGQASLNEWYVLCFRSVCQNCGLISLWHLDLEEVKEILQRTQDGTNDGHAIDWIYNPESLKQLLEKVEPSAIKDQITNLLKDLKVE